MCKVSGVTKVTDQNRDAVWIFMMLLGQRMTPGNNDGLGYAAFDKQGNIFGEKWLINQMAFNDISKMLGGLSSAKMDRVYSFFGEKVLRDEAQAIILHTRAATCGKGIENTHPFVDNIEKPSAAIIHNGIIYNHHELTKKFSTCDSEVIVHEYMDNKVNLEFTNINNVTKKLGGWYTVAALSKDSEGAMVMDVFSDSPRLTSYFIPELDTRVYSTSAEDIEAVAKKLNVTIQDGKRIKQNTAFRVNVLTGEMMAACETTPRVTERRSFIPEGMTIMEWLNKNSRD